MKLGRFIRCLVSTAPVVVFCCLLVVGMGGVEPLGVWWVGGVFGTLLGFEGSHSSVPPLSACSPVWGVGGCWWVGVLIVG